MIAGMSPEALDELIGRALAEDLADGPDATTLACVPAGHRSRLDFVARQRGVVAGLPVAARAFELVGPVVVELSATDGDHVRPGRVLLTATGSTRHLLTAERTALNFLGHMSGVATATAAWVDALAGGGARVRDTRKTLPGLRALEKYSVRCGGGVNHRMSLSDAALVKDNHIVAAGGVTEAFDAVRRQYPGLTIEVEVDSLDQLREVLDAGADLVLLDNFTPDQMREAVAVNAGRARLEASGGLTLEVAAEVGATGVDYVSVGALTHSARVLDIGADLQEVEDAAGH